MSEKGIGGAIAPLLGTMLPAASSQSPDALLALFVALVPAVPMPVARQMLADKARSEMYKAEAAGELEFVKDGNKTLVTTPSIIAYRTRYRPFAAGKREAPRRNNRRGRKSNSIGSGEAT